MSACRRAARMRKLLFCTPTTPTPVLPHWSSTKGTSCHSYTAYGLHRPRNHHRLIGGYAGYVFRSRPLLAAAPFAGKWGPKWSPYSRFPLVRRCRSAPLWPPTQLSWPPMWLLYHDGATAADQILVTAVHLAAVPDFPYFAGIELVGFDYVGPDLVCVMADLTHLPPNPNKIRLTRPFLIVSTPFLNGSR